MRCRYILRGHTGIVHCLWVKGNRLYSGGGTRSVVYLLIGMLLLGQCFSRSVQVTGFLERCLIVRLLFGLKNT